jgi:hypothetical protein
MKKSLLALAFVGILAATSLAQSISGGFSVLAQRKNTIAVVDIPVTQLKQVKAWTVSIDSLFGANATTQEPAIGGAIAAHWHKSASFGLVFGLGATYDTSKAFQWSKVKSDSVGLLAGAQWTF